MRCRAALILTVLSGTGFAPGTAAEASYRIIVHPSVKGTQIPRATLNSIFLKYAPRWGDGSPVLPVDQSMRSPVRQSFAADVLQKPLVEVQIFWNHRVAAGVTPPPVKQTDDEIVAYVAATPGSIGYVSSGFPLPDGVRAITVLK